MIDLSFFKNKRVFITGHTGFKGTWLSRILLLAGAELTGYSLAPQTKSIFAITDTKNHMQSIEADIRDYEKLSCAMQNAKPDIVFHLAAQPIVRESYKNPVYTYETNVMGTVSLLEAVRSCESVQSVVNVTTDKVYRNKEWHWGYRENEELCGHDPYSNSKSCSELVTHSYVNSFFVANESLAISTARSGNVIGGGDFAQDRIIPDCVRAVQSGKEIILRNPSSTRPYQHVLECLSGYLLLSQKQFGAKQFAGAYNFGPDDDSCVTTGELADLFCKFVGNGASWQNVQDANAPHEANFLKLDNSKAKAVLGWMPKWNIENAVEKVVEWHKAVDGFCAAGTNCNADDTSTKASAQTDAQIKKYFRGHF